MAHPSPFPLTTDGVNIFTTFDGETLLPLNTVGVYPVTDTYAVVNDAPAINAAIASASSGAHPGGVVWVPPGSHRLKSGIIGSSNVTLQGAGTGCKLLVDDSGGNIGDAVTATNTYGFGVKDLVISAVSPRTAGSAIRIRGGDPTKLLSPSYPLAANRTVVENVDMDSQFNGLLVDNAGANSQWLLHVDKGRWSNFNGGWGLWLNANTAPGNPGFGASHFIRRLFMYENPANAPAAGGAFRIQGTGDFNITECETFGLQYGVRMDVPANGFVTTGRFTNCFFDTCGQSCAMIDPNASVAGFGDIAFTGCWFAGAAAGHGLYLNSATANNVRAVNCIFAVASAFGVVFAAGCSKNIIDGCTFWGNGAGAFISTGNATDWSIVNSMWTQTLYNGTIPQPCGQIDLGSLRFILANNNMHDVSAGLVDNSGGVSKITTPNIT